MALIDDIRNFLSGNKPSKPPVQVTNPVQPSFGQRLMEQVRPVTNFIQQNPTPVGFIQNRINPPIVSPLPSPKPAPVIQPLQTQPLGILKDQFSTPNLKAYGENLKNIFSGWQDNPAQRFTSAIDNIPLARKNFQSPLPQITNPLFNTGETVLSGMSDVVKGTQNVVRGRIPQGAAQVGFGVGKTLTPFAGPAFQVANVATQNAYDPVQRLAKGFIQGQTGLDTLAPDVQNKNIKVGPLEFDPLVAGGSMVGFTKNPTWNKIFPITGKLLNMPINNPVAKFVVGRLAKGGTEGIIQELAKLPQDAKPEDYYKLVEGFLFGAGSEFVSDTAMAGGKKALGTIGENPAVKSLIYKISEEWRRANRPYATTQVDSVTGKRITVPLWQHTLFGNMNGKFASEIDAKVPETVKTKKQKLEEDLIATNKNVKFSGTQSPGPVAEPVQTAANIRQQIEQSSEELLQQSPMRPSSLPSVPLKNTPELSPQLSQSVSSQVPSDGIIPRQEWESNYTQGKTPSPKKLYHGTNDTSSSKIDSEGFKPLYEGGPVSLTDDPKIAQKFAEQKARLEGGTPRVIEVDAEGTQSYKFQKGKVFGEQDREYTFTPDEAKKLKISSVKTNVIGEIPRKQVEASDLNVKRLDLNQEQQARVSDSQVKELRDVLGDKEVERIAKGAGIDTKTHTTEQQAKKIAEQLNVRRQVVELENQRTQLLSGGGTPEQLADITRQIAQKSRISREQGTEVARQLSARRIIANEINTPMQRVFQLLDQAGVNPDVYAKDAALVDFRDGNQVVDFYRKYVPADKKDWLDLVRYNSMLSSPNTFINNFSSNLQGSAVIAPIEKSITGAVDAVKAALTGSKREYYIGEGPAYLKGYIASIGKAKENFTNVLRGKNLIANPDFKNIPLTQSGTTGRKLENILNTPMKYLEATDQFFTTLTKGGSEASLNYKASKGGMTGDIGLVSEAEAAKRLFRSPLGDNNGSYVLNAIDTLANTIQRLKSDKNPVVSTIAKYTLPFVQTPTNILKQGLEYSPFGVITLPGSNTKTEQISKTIMGTSIATGVAMLLGSDRLTWAEPTSEKQKAAFRDAGMQPYAVKIGDKWVSYAKFHPAIAFNLALVAAVKNAEDNKDLDENQAQTILKGAAKWLNFFADQSYIKSIGELVAATKGDIESPAKILGNYAQQTVPFRALSGWVARIVDPYQRKVDTDGSILQQQFDYLKTQIPLLSQTVPARENQFGEPIKNQNGLLNALSPARITTEKPSAVEDFKFLQEQSKFDKEKRQMKEKVIREAKQETTVQKVGAAESAEVLGKGLPNVQISTKNLIQSNGAIQKPKKTLVPLSKQQKEKVKTYLEYGKSVSADDLVNYYLGDITPPQSGSNYEKTLSQREMLKAYDKVEKDESLSATQRKTVQDAISEQSGLTLEQIKYNKVANQDNDLKYQYLSDQMRGRSHEQILKILAEGRKESVTGDILTTDDVLKNMYDDGIIDSSEFGALKKIKYTNNGQLKQSKTGGGKKKLSGIKFDTSIKSTPISFKFKRPSTYRAPVNLLSAPKLKALSFKGKPLKFKRSTVSL